LSEIIALYYRFPYKAF